MYKITLEWTQDNQRRSQTISSQQQTKVPGIVRIGRDPGQCDVVVQDPNNHVSRLHAEVFLNRNSNLLYLRNATSKNNQPNVVLLDEQTILENELPLRDGSIITLRDFLIEVAHIELESLQQQATRIAQKTPQVVQQNASKQTAVSNNQQPEQKHHNYQTLINNNSPQAPANINKNSYQSTEVSNQSNSNFQQPDIAQPLKQPQANKQFNQQFNNQINSHQANQTQNINPTSDTTNKGEIKLGETILQRASQDDFDAIVTMFRQFIPEDEKIYIARYLGIQGLWGFGTRQFACVTDRRVADITVGRFGEVNYQDGYLEHINSGVIYQPSKFWLYLLIIGYFLFGGIYFILPLFSVFTILLSSSILEFTALLLPLFGLALFFLFLPILIKWYYRTVKCGLVLTVREGEIYLNRMGGYAFTHRLVYLFTNRRLITRASALYRSFIIQREVRLNEVEKYPL